jgi:hypothetical protein
LATARSGPIGAGVFLDQPAVAVGDDIDRLVALDVSGEKILQRLFPDAAADRKSGKARQWRGHIKPVFDLLHRSVPPKDDAFRGPSGLGGDSTQHLLRALGRFVPFELPDGWMDTAVVECLDGFDREPRSDVTVVVELVLALCQLLSRRWDQEFDEPPAPGRRGPP